VEDSPVARPELRLHQAEHVAPVARPAHPRVRVSPPKEALDGVRETCASYIYVCMY